MASPALVAALRRGREKTVELDGGLKVKFLRPPETRFPLLLKDHPTDPDKRLWNITLKEAQEFVVGWEGFTEATFIGASIGSSDPIEFDLQVWKLYVEDNVVALQKVADAILDSIVDYIEKREIAAKNSEVGSTPQAAPGSEQTPSNSTPTT